MSSQKTRGLPAPVTTFLSWDRKVNSIEQTPSLPSNLKRGGIWLARLEYSLSCSGPEPLHPHKGQALFHYIVIAFMI